MTDTLHFEQIYEQAESIALKSSSKNIDTIIIELTNTLNEYKSFNDSNLPTELKQPIKVRKFGELLFLLCELSAVENINSYTALQDQIKNNT